MTIRERELYVAAGVASYDIKLNAESLRDLVINLLATVEELQRVNVGLIGENAQLKRRLAEQPETRSGSPLPGLEQAYALIGNALRDAQ